MSRRLVRQDGGEVHVDLRRPRRFSRTQPFSGLRTANGVPVLSGQYWGKRQIAERMKCSVSHLEMLYDKHAFFMFKLPNIHRAGPRTAKMIGPPEMWYTDEVMIYRWMMMRYLEQRRARKRVLASERVVTARDQKGRPVCFGAQDSPPAAPQGLVSEAEKVPLAVTHVVEKSP